MSITAFAGCAVVISILLLILRQQKPEMGVVATAAAGVVLMAAILRELFPVIKELGNLLNTTETGEYIAVVLKGLGVCIVTQLGADICRDSGQQTMASSVEMAGRIAMVIIALPIMTRVLDAALGIIR